MRTLGEVPPGILGYRSIFKIINYSIFFGGARGKKKNHVFDDQNFRSIGEIFKDRDPLVKLGGRKKKKKLIFPSGNAACSPHVVFFRMST
jgi:hypothetical protein